MNLENVTAELRPRGAWEAVDLGARMVRRDAAQIYRVWFAMTLPMLSVVMLLIYLDVLSTWAFFFYWWFEPVLDGPILHIISRRLFGESVDYKKALRMAPRLAMRNWLFILTPYRFHFARSIALPVVQLEGLRGKARRARASILNQGIFNYGIGVTTAYQHLVLALYFGVALLGFLFVPLEYQDSIGLTWMSQFWESDTRMASALALLVSYAAQTALHPWFVGCGFGLYINRRTELEAWDIEVAFRRMAHRRQAGFAAGVLLLLCLPAILLPSPAQAEDAGAAEAEAVASIGGYWSDDEVQPAVESIYATDALQTERDASRWSAIEKKDEPEKRRDRRRWSSISRLFGLAAEFGLWLIAGLLLGLLFATRKRWLPYLRPGAPRQRRQRTRVSLAGGEIRAEELPDNIPQAVMRLWRDGERRAATSLLYRASVLALVSVHGIELPASATEGACVDAVRRQSPDAAFAGNFHSIVMAWVMTAYGGRTLADEQVAALCDAWPGLYGAQP